MKHNYFFRKTLLAVALLLGGASFSWADDFNGNNANNKVSVPGTFDLSYGSYTGFKSGASISSFTTNNKIEYSQANCAVTFNFTASSTGTFVFSLEASNGNNAGDYPATLSVKIYGESESEPSDATFTITVPDDNNWNNFVGYLFETSELTAGDYKLKIIWSDQANVQNIKLTSPSSFKEIPTFSFDISTGYSFSGGNYNTTGGYLDNMQNGNFVTYLVHNSVASNILNMSFKAATPNDGSSLTVTFTNGTTSATATKNITKNGTSNVWTTFVDHDVALGSTLPVGYYVMKITMNGSNYTANVKDIAFRQIAALNESTNYTPEAGYANVTLTRSITAGNWSTIVLPFDMTAEQITSAFGAGSQVAQLTSFTDNKIKFTTVSSMNAHEPYLIKVASNFSSATINGVTITEGNPSKTTVSGVDFIGSYNALTDIPFSDDNTSYYFLSNNTLYRSSTGTTHDTMKGFRAYFKVLGTASSRGLTFDVNDEQGGTTGVNEELRIKNEGSSNAPVYNLNGQRISHPSKGLYIVNGKKVIIK